MVGEGKFDMNEMLGKVLGAAAWQGAEVDGSSGRQGTAGTSLPGRLQAHAGGGGVEAPRVVLRDPGRSCGSEQRAAG